MTDTPRLAPEELRDRARPIARDLLSAGISLKHFKAAMVTNGLPASLAPYYLRRWAHRITKTEVTAADDPSLAANRVRVDYQFTAAREPE